MYVFICIPGLFSIMDIGGYKDREMLVSLVLQTKTISPKFLCLKFKHFNAAKQPFKLYVVILHFRFILSLFLPSEMSIL